MKVPFPANNSKPLNFTITTTHTTAFPAPTASAYEPKSVLDLRRSPSPVAEKPVSTGPLPVLEETDHELINQHLEGWDSLMRELGLHDDSPPDSKPINIIPSSTLPELPQVTSSFDSNQFVPADFGLFSDIPATYTATTAPLNQNSDAISSFDGLSGDFNGGGAGNWNAGFDYVDELIRLAECFETNSVQLGHVILARLNQRLSSPTGKPLQRAAFYFKEALQSLLTGATRPDHRAVSSFGDRSNH
ncbi:Scarecrow-like protein 15 [Sesamum alatum]|uniref:Scarecrow-like protein 15 n=1 Tax=Sesamum alatum TaxID=300844 RepID=A0AAE1XS70_9LAMI|nr:Scarecrow-like protein 15 [Sesamum alatum]